MKKVLLILSFFSLTVAYGQTDSTNSKEISFGISVIPLLYPAYGGVSGNMPSLGLNIISKYGYGYAIPININYRFLKNNKREKHLSFMAVVPVKEYSDFSYYTFSYGKTFINLNKKRTFSLNGDLLLGYLKYNGWGVGGMFTWPKYYDGADLLLTGCNIGLTSKHKLTDKLFLENEIYFLIYFAGGNLYYNNYISGVNHPTTITGSKMGITFSKFFSFNLGYKL